MSPPKPLRSIDTGRGEAHGCCDCDDVAAPVVAAAVVPAEGGDCVSTTADAVKVVLVAKGGVDASVRLPGVADVDSVQKRVAEAERDEDAARLTDAVGGDSDGVAAEGEDDIAALLSAAVALIALVALPGISTVMVAVDDADRLKDGAGVVVVSTAMLCVSESEPLGENACEAVNDGVLDSDEPLELVTVAEGNDEAPPVTEAVSVGDCDHVAVLVPEPGPPCVTDPL